MKATYDHFSFAASKAMTWRYSTSFSWAVSLLDKKIRADIYNIYGFVRLADEIVDSFHGFDKERLLNQFEATYDKARTDGISINPIINSFILTTNKYDIPDHLVKTFLQSMRSDLFKNTYQSQDEFNEYVYGSADVVGLMCLKIFVNGDQKLYENLKPAAMRLGSGFQKVNFLRDLKQDVTDLNRSYFPNVDFDQLDSQSVRHIVEDIEADFNHALKNGILKLPKNARLGVYIAYNYYTALLKKIKWSPVTRLKESRIRISNFHKFILSIQGYIKYKLS
ncbi:MAG: phytoene/squalene synthase family protein [Flavobacteriaceae bacterium]